MFTWQQRNHQILKIELFLNGFQGKKTATFRLEGRLHLDVLNVEFGTSLIFSWDTARNVYQARRFGP